MICSGVIERITPWPRSDSSTGWGRRWLLLSLAGGILTDVTGIILLFPPTRYFVRQGEKRWISKYILMNI